MFNAMSTYFKNTNYVKKKKKKLLKVKITLSYMWNCLKMKMCAQATKI